MANPVLINAESGGNWKATNNAKGHGGKRGHYGRLQFGHARLQDYMKATGLYFTPEEFKNSPVLQQEVEDWHFQDIDQYRKDRGYGHIDKAEFEAVAHLGGKRGASKYYNSGGKYNPPDTNGTRLSKYAALGRGSGGATSMANASAAPASSKPDYNIADLADPQKAQAVIAKIMQNPKQGGAMLQQILGKLTSGAFTGANAAAAPAGGGQASPQYGGRPNNNMARMIGRDAGMGQGQFNRGLKAPPMPAQHAGAVPSGGGGGVPPRLPTDSGTPNGLPPAVPNPTFYGEGGTGLPPLPELRQGQQHPDPLPPQIMSFLSGLFK